MDTADDFEAQIAKVLPLLIRLGASSDQSGQVRCPVCGGVVDWGKVPSNGHLRVRCRTLNCVEVIQ